MSDFHKTPLDYAKGESWAHSEVKAVKRQTADLLLKHGGKVGDWLNADYSIHKAASAGHIDDVTIITK